jgi:inositol 1,4,5-triphosphate receptor type 3
MVLSLFSGLDGECTSNVSLYKKLTGTSLLFQSSQFHLVHVESLKFLCLNDKDPENLYFQLVDFPSEGTVLKFLPCLNYQKLRTNVIYDGDPVILSCVKAVCNRLPQLYFIILNM